MGRDRILIIAEAGVNHNGDMALARQLVDAAADAGADVVKFQSFKTERLVVAKAPKAEYQKKATQEAESQFDMLRRYELDEDAHRMLAAYCEEKGIQFLSSPFDEESVDFLVQLGVSMIKVPSGEITNLPYLRRIGQHAMPVLLSTGMSSMDDVWAALDILEGAGTPRKMITVLQCNTQYPTPYESANIRAMLTMQQELGVSVGFSDHTVGIEVCVAAAAMGATVLEKHLTLDKDLQGPDHAASADPSELKALVDAVRHVESALGSGIKEPSSSELENVAVARKFLVAAKNIREGEVFSPDNLVAKRIGREGVSPMLWDSIIGSVADRAYSEDDPILWKGENGP